MKVGGTGLWMDGWMDVANAEKVWTHILDLNITKQCGIILTEERLKGN